MYVVILVDEADNEDDEGDRRGLGEDGDNALDHRGNRRRGASVDANGGAGGGVVGCALFCGLIGADGERHRQPGATRPLNALASSLVLATSVLSSSTARTWMWTSTGTLSQRCDAPPS